MAAYLVAMVFDPVGVGTQAVESDVPPLGRFFSVPCDTAALRSTIENTATGTIQLADNCIYVVGPATGPSGVGVSITRKNDLTIQGHGAGRTYVQFTRDVHIGFHMDGNVDGLTMRDMTIEGSITEPDPQDFCGGSYPLESDRSCNGYCPNPGSGDRPNTHAIVVRGPNTRNVTYTGLEVRNVAVGINLNGDCDGTSTCSDAIIENNYLHDIRGSCPGAGYGIATACVRNLVVRGNTIRGAERHSIYQMRTQDPPPGRTGDNVLIEGNLILDHRHGNFHEGPAWHKSALVIARSGFVTAISNVIVNSHEIPISVEYNELVSPPTPAENVYLINNRILGPAFNKTGKDIWLNAGGKTPVVMWFNRRNETRAASHRLTSGTPVAPQLWSGTQWIESSAGDGQLYVMQRNSLHKVTPDYQTHPDSWSYTQSVTIWSGFQSMATMSDGYVYMMRRNLLHRITPQSGTGVWPSWYSTNRWSGFQGLTAQHGRLYVMQDNCLNMVTPRDSTSSWALMYHCGWATFSGVRAGADGHIWIYRRGGARTDKVDLEMNIVATLESER